MTHGLNWSTSTGDFFFQSIIMHSFMSFHNISAPSPKVELAKKLGKLIKFNKNYQFEWYWNQFFNDNRNNQNFNNHESFFPIQFTSVSLKNREKKTKANEYESVENKYFGTNQIQIGLKKKKTTTTTTKRSA